MEIIYLCGLVQFPIINENPPTRDNPCKNQLILFVFLHCHATFLRNTMNRAYHTISQIGQMILSSNHLMISFFTTSFMIGFSLLWFSMLFFRVLLQLYIMHTITRTNSLYVISFPSYSFLVPSQKRQKLTPRLFRQFSYNDHWQLLSCLQISILQM